MGRKKGKRKRRWFAAVGLLFAAAAGWLFWINGRPSNTLMKNRMPERETGNLAMAGMLGTALAREKIISVTFLDTLEQMPTDSWDVSEVKNGSVMAWTEEKENGCVLYIAGEGGVKANADSSQLFRGCVKF